MNIKMKKDFANGSVYCFALSDGMLIETTDTFLPLYTKDAINRNQNFLDNDEVGDRSERWMIGVSVMSGCPIRCKFCATGQMKKWRNLTAEEIVSQVEFMISLNERNPKDSAEFKINYTRMGDIAYNFTAVKDAIEIITKLYPNAHHFVSTVGIKGFDFSWIKDNITLQLSLHSLNDETRKWLIPSKKLMTIEELGCVRTNSKLKTTLNLTLINNEELDVNKLKMYFNPEYFFIKLSPVNENIISVNNNISGVIEGKNLL